MKRFFAGCIAILSLSMATVAADTEVKALSSTQKIFKPLLELHCANELKSSKIWQASSLFWSAQQQSHAQQKICGCVSDHALEDVSTQDLFWASVNEAAKNKLIQQAVMSSLKGCAQQALK